jgi:hypothetical protein
MIKRGISFIERFQPAAGKMAALVAKINKPFTQPIAVVAHVYAVSATGAAAGAV